MFVDEAANDAHILVLCQFDNLTKSQNYPSNTETDDLVRMVIIAFQRQLLLRLLAM